MDKRFTNLKTILFLLLIMIIGKTTSQINIKVKVLSVSVANTVDSDGFLSGNSDFAFEYSAIDNTLGLINNSPAAFGLTGDFNFSYQNGNNGPWSLTVNSVFFDHDYLCPADIPTSVDIKWQGYENDAPIVNWDLTGTFSELRTGIQTQTVPIPSTPGSTGTLSYSANGSSNGQTQSYTITFEVIRTNLNVVLMEDNICNALNIPVDNSIHRYAYCGNYTIETGEPIFQSIGNSGHGSTWFYFTLPSTSSGNIRIDTDFPETNFGTEIALYHAADSVGCLQGVNNFNSLQIKNKFNYLSEHSYADDDIPIIAPEGLATGNWNGGLISEGDPLIPGQTYYIQFNTDAANQNGSVGIKITDLGGTPTTLNDIPCTSILLTGNIPSTSVSTENNNSGTPNLTLSYSNATDREAGASFTGTNNSDFVAYTYAPPSGTSNSIDENVWFNFTAPNSGRVYFEGEVTGFLSVSEAEDIALYGLDNRFAPGRPSDLFCSNLSQLDASAGSVSGSNRTAKINATCLEPGYKYYGMLDPQNVSTTSSGKIWIYDPSVADPSFNAPGNDILCLTIADTLYEVPVILSGTNPTFQAVAGSNVRACREYLAGEPAANSDANLRADQTVWHYFVAPPSGAVEMSIRAYIGMDTLRYSVYELLNGNDCYGGLQPATYTLDGTQNTQIITPIMSGTAGYNGSQTSACCMEPGKIYAIQIDGGHPGDEGEYIIEYIKEVNSDAGDIFVDLANGTTIEITAPDTAFVCYGDVLTPGIMVNGIGESTADLPSCLTPGYVIHQLPILPDPIANTGFTFIDSLQSENGVFTNNGNGSGTFGNPLFNTLYYVSPAGDITADWGDFSCGTSTVEAGLPVVFLQALNTNFTYNNTTCTASFSATGGLNSFYNHPFTYTITSPLGTVVQTGTMAPGATVTYTGALAGTYTILINDGACPKTITFSGCNTPCVPTTNNVSTSICQGSSILLGGSAQTQSGVYTDVFITSQGCDSTVITTLTVNPTKNITVNNTICQGSSIQIGTNSYNTQGVYVDTLQTFNGCDSVVTSILFITPAKYSFDTQTICNGESFNLGGQLLTQSGIYQDTVQTAAGCDSIINLELSVQDCAGDFEISNILTPNDDGQNDTWKVSDITYISGCSVKIYNRWGQPVFETTNYQNDWGGTKNGEPLPDGVYFYVISCSEQEFKGSINLLRFKK